MQGMYQDGESGEFGELRAYVMSKLMWDPSLDVEELISDFMAAYYGAAAEQMTDYLDSLSAALKKTDKDWYLVDPAQMYKDVLTEDDITRLDGLWTAQKNATEGHGCIRPRSPQRDTVALLQVSCGCVRICTRCLRYFR